LKNSIALIKEKQDRINNQCRVSIDLERKIQDICSGLRIECSRLLYTISEDNALTIGNYIQALRIEVNPSDHYRSDVIKLLCTFSKFHSNHPFNAMNKDDIISFLESYRKSEAVDPMHRWIGTYNIYRMHLVRFFRWLYYSDNEPRKRPKPEMIQNILQLKRKEQSIYKPTDLWTVEDDLLFLKYCPSKRIKCYHAMSRDTGSIGLSF
jgi:hypothetical protein